MPRSWARASRIGWVDRGRRRSGWISRCRCGPVEWPVLPESDTTSPGLTLLALGDLEPAVVGVPGDGAVPVLDLDLVAVAARPAGEDDRAARHRLDAACRRHREVLGRVHGAPAHPEAGGERVADAASGGDPAVAAAVAACAARSAAAALRRWRAACSCGRALGVLRGDRVELGGRSLSRAARSWTGGPGSRQGVRLDVLVLLVVGQERLHCAWPPARGRCCRRPGRAAAACRGGTGRRQPEPSRPAAVGSGAPVPASRGTDGGRLGTVAPVRTGDDAHGQERGQRAEPRRWRDGESAVTLP